MSAMLADVPPVAVAWILTFSIHGAALFLIAWMCARGRAPIAIQEVAWKLALAGAVVTSSAQVALVSQPVAGHVALVSASVGVDAAVAPEAFAPPSATTALDAASLEAGPAAEPSGVPWAALVFWLAAIAGGVGVAWRAVALARWRRSLRGRRTVWTGRVNDALARLAERIEVPRGLVVSTATRLSSPVAFGVLRPEICVPTRALGLDDRALDAMLAHELGHIVRRDPAWLSLCGWLQAACPWQPFVGLARRRLVDLMELRCDAFGARLSDRDAVARCLVEVAGWVVDGSVAPACGMAVRRSSLRARVERLLAGRDDDGRGERRWLRAPALTLACAAMALVLPGAEIPKIAPGEPKTAEATRAADAATLVAELLELFDADRGTLEREVDGLRRQLAGMEPDPVLSALLERIQRRIEQLDADRRTLAELLSRIAVAPAPVTPPVNHEERD